MKRRNHIYIYIYTSLKRESISPPQIFKESSQKPLYFYIILIAMKQIVVVYEKYSNLSFT